MNNVIRCAASALFLTLLISALAAGGDISTSVSSAPSRVAERNMILDNAYAGWNFDTVDGWSGAAGMSDVKAIRGVLSARITGNDAALYTPDGLRIPCAAIRTVEFRMKTEQATGVRLCWKTADSDWSWDKSASISVKHNGEYSDYQIELSQHPKWTGTVLQLKLYFTGAHSGNVSLDYFRLTGLYFVPFAMLSGDMAKDIETLTDIKRSFPNPRRTVVVGYSIHLEYFSGADDSGNYRYDAGNLTNPAYHVKLAKITGMPVMFWLRGDPWGYQTQGTYKRMLQDDNAVMWTAAADGTRYYHNSHSGFGYLCLAAADLHGQKTPYWQQTEHLLGQCAEKVGSLIRQNPGCILGVTTTSEYKFNAEDSSIDLDYNPNTICEFRDYCKRKFGSDLSVLNSRMKTAFSTWELKSTDYDPGTVEYMGGFDAPRNRNISDVFWNEWTVFRGTQIRAAVQHQVDIISRHIDGKYIYTHQIPSSGDPACSPVEAGNIKGSNVGIDMFNSEATETNIRRVAEFVAGDYSRSWGVPEWLPTAGAGYDESLNVLHLMNRYGIKYLAPLAWGCGEPYEVKGSPSELACRKFLSELSLGN